MFIQAICIVFTGPALPHATAHHCLVEIEEAYFVLAGGADLDNGVYHDTVDLYDFDDEQWYTAPAMAKPLWGHACGVVHDGNGGSSLIVTGEGGNIHQMIGM